MKTDRLMPRRRFVGYNEEWKERKLGDEANRIIAGGDVNKELIMDKGKYPVIANGFNNDGIIGYYEFDYRVKAPSVTVTGRGDVGYAKARYVDFTPVVRLISIESNHDVEFLENAINKSGTYVESTGVPQLTVPQLAKININFPNTLAEESKIGMFYVIFNKLITLQRQKLSKLKAIKKAYLYEIFPQERESLPKRRFSGFTDAWEQRKLGDTVKINMGQSPDSANYTEDPDDSILVQGNADMKNGRVVPRVWTTQVTKTAEKGDLILSVRAPVGDVGKTDYDVVLGRGVAGIKGNEFMFQLLSKMNFDSYWRKLSTGSTFESINSNDIKEAQIKLPKSEEQELIGQFFANIDTTISLQQRKIEKLQELKKAYLNDMFV